MAEVVQVIITVLDVNDNVPSFTMPLYMDQVSETAGMGFTVLTVFANDPDFVSFENVYRKHKIFGL